MNRPIKFRAWNGKEERMVYDFSIHSSGFDPYNGESPLMQFTGLTDKNGKEIYEGDIVRYESNTGPRNAAVYWRHGSLGYQMRASLKDGEAGEIMDIPRTPPELEVVGNIYENPELLTN